MKTKDNKKKKEIYVDRVKIYKVGLIIYIISIIFMVICGLIIMLKTNSTDRAQILGWCLLGFAGYYSISRFEMNYLDLENKEESKQKKKINKKEVKKLSTYFIILLIVAQIINFALVFYLSSTNLSNLAVVLIYIPAAIGWNMIVVVYGILLLLWKSDFEISKIIKKLKKQESSK